MFLIIGVWVGKIYYGIVLSLQKISPLIGTGRGMSVSVLK